MITRKILLACFVLLLCSATVCGEEYDISGLWNIKGQGFAEKSFVRVKLSLSGNMTLKTSTAQEVAQRFTGYDANNVDARFLTSYDINLRIDATGIDIKAWEDNIPNGIEIPVPLPEMRPTVNEPYTLPVSLSSQGLTYTFTLTSTESGKVRITGYVDLDTIGVTEINTDCALWKYGTPMPAFESETSSGCDSGFGAWVIALLLLGVRKNVRD